MVRRFCLVLLVVAPGCGPDDPPCAPDPPETQSLAGEPTTGVIETADDGTQAEARRPLTRAALAGFYTDREGYGLTLRGDGSFDCSAGCCLGSTGSAAGTWEVGPSGVTLIYTRADGVLATRPPEPMRVAALGPHYLLVENRWLEFFQRTGPAPLACNLRQPAAETAIADAYYRRIERKVRGPEAAPAPDRAGGQ